MISLNLYQEGCQQEELIKIAASRRKLIITKAKIHHVDNSKN